VIGGIMIIQLVESFLLLITTYHWLNLLAAFSMQHVFPWKLYIS